MNILPVGKKMIHAALGKFGYIIRNSAYLSNLENEICMLIAENAAQKQINEKIFSIFPHIYVCALPKSASSYLCRYINDNSQYNFDSVGSYAFPRTQICYERAIALNRPSIIHSHTDICDENLILMSIIFKKVILHIRDPRNALASWIHDCSEKNNTSPQWTSSYHMRPYIGPWFVNKSNEEKFEFAFNNFYKESIKWLSDWFDILKIDFSAKYCSIFEMKTIDSIENSSKYEASMIDEKIKILITKHEDLVKNEEDFFGNIFSFYNIPDVFYRLIPIDKDNAVNFRSGKTDSWTTEFTPEQQKRVSALLPREWCTYFGWDSTTARSGERERERERERSKK